MMLTGCFGLCAPWPPLAAARPSVESVLGTL